MNSLKNKNKPMLNIEKKIEEIRQKPEHIRLRYTWGMVAVSMVAVLTIWFVSIKVNFANFDDNVSGTVNDAKNQFDILESGQSSEESYVGDGLGDGSDSSSIDDLLEEARKNQESEGDEEGVR